MTQRLNQRGGFTLLELLMVVIIIGILAALALPSYIRAVERSRTAEVTTVIGQIKGATQRYCAQSDGTAPGGYVDLDVDDPTTIAGLGAPGGRWDFSGFPAVACNPFAMTMTVNRVTGPCAGSSVAYDSTVPSNPFTYTWGAGTPCA